MPASTDPAQAAEGPSGDGRPYPDFPGQLLGRPERGPGSIARLPRRILAFAIDWYLCYAICLWILGPLDGWLGLAAPIAFWLYQSLLVGFGGHALGHFVCGMQVQTMAGGPAGFRRAAVRSLLILPVIPVVVVDENSRGLHDRCVGTVLVLFR
jgi:uncharacterized RDD family membrane protein YckC